MTEKHARTCRESGHATHTVDGVDAGWCPRCGDVTAPAPAVRLSWNESTPDDAPATFHPEACRCLSCELRITLPTIPR